MSTSVDVRRIKWLSFSVEDGDSANCAIDAGGRSRGKRRGIMTWKRGPGVDCRWPGTGDFGFLERRDLGVLEVKIECFGCV